MKCYFRKEVECPVPERYLNGDYCVACSSWENVKANMIMAEMSRKMADATILTMPEGRKTTPDERKEVA